MPGRHKVYKPCHDTCHVFKSGLFSIISKSISNQSCFLCKTNLKL